MNTEISLITNLNDIELLVEAAQERYDYLAAKVSKMPKMKALELINQAYPGYEATDVYTVKANLGSAYEQYTGWLNTRRDELIAAQEAEIAAAQPGAYDLKTIDGILHALKNGAYIGGPAETSTQRKNLRSKLRKLGYRLSDQKSAE